MKQANAEGRILHNYFRSSSSYRVRIALNLKGLPYQYVPVHLNRDGGEQFRPGFKELNPQGLVPVLKFITGGLGLGEEAKMTWIRHWTELGLSALEQELSRSEKRGKFCFGDTPTIADCCLVPQLFNAQRFNIDLAPYPTLVKINNTCLILPESMTGAIRARGSIPSRCSRMPTSAAIR